MATHTRKQTPAKPTAKKTARPPRKTTAKKALPTTAPVNRATTTDIRRPLPTRRPAFTGPLSTVEQAAIRAALASAAARLPIPVSAWHGPTAHLADGTTLTHTPAHATTDHTPTFHTVIRCPHGAVHAYTIHTADELHRARTLTAQCQQRTRTTATGTQLVPAITPVIPIDTDQPKDHPQP